jgi:NAD(P)H-nitrite reductase large subunit
MNLPQSKENDDEIICSCSGTTRDKIISLFLEGFDAEAISRKTGAISGCGGCEWDIAQIKEAVDLASNDDAVT